LCESSKCIPEKDLGGSHNVNIHTHFGMCRDAPETAQKHCLRSSLSPKPDLAYINEEQNT
jgi:hypothetical protein